MKARDLSTLVIYVGLIATMGLGATACRDHGEESEHLPTPASPAMAAEASPKLAESTEPPLRILRDEGPMPSSDTILASGDGLEITLADFEAAMARSLLFAPLDEEGVRMTAVPEERLAMPHLHITATQNLVAQRIIVAEANAQGLSVESRDEQIFFADHPVLSRFTPLFDPDADHGQAEAELAALGLTLDDLRTVAHEEILARKLEDHLVSAIDDDALWDAYRRSTDTVSLLVVSATHTPSSKELDEFLDRDALRDTPRIDAHFRANPDRYVSPAGARLTLLKAQAGQGGPELEENLKQAERRLSSGEDPASAASGLGLKLEEDVFVLKTENPRAFESRPGTIGYETAGPRGAYAWRVEEHLAPSPLELTRPLRREIAAELLRQGEVLPSVKERLAQGLEILRNLSVDADGTPEPDALEAAREELRKLRLTLTETGHFPRTPGGHVPNLGLAEELVPRAFALTPQKPIVDEPILSRDRVHVVRLLGRNIPTRADFRRDRAAFFEAYRDQTRPAVLQELILRRQNELNVTYDVRPLRVKYGVLAKD